MLRSITAVLLVACTLFTCKVSEKTALPFQQEINQFKADDKLNGIRKNAILFAGSSSFTYWKGVKLDLGCDKIINRGFGGSTLNDLLLHKKFLFSSIRPKQIFIYCGENDLATDAKISTGEVLERWKKLHQYIRKQNPKTDVYFLSLKPSPARWHLKEKMQEVNKLIKQYNQQNEHTYFIDLWPSMITPENKPKPDIFLKDSLHMNNGGYDIWVDHIRPKLDCN